MEFEAPFKLGQPVKVTPDFKYYGDWENAELFVTGMKLSVSGDIDIEVCEGDLVTSPTDGFTPDDLTVRNI